MTKTVFFTTGIKPKFTAASLVLVANAFIWYLLAFDTLKGLIPDPDKLVLFGVNAGAIAVSAIIGSFVIDKFKKRVLFLYLWMFAGVIISLIPLALNIQNFSHLITISFLFGAYFGLGMPVTMGYFSTSIKVEKRATVSGFTILIIGLSFFALDNLSIDSLVLSCLILAVIRILGLLIFYGLDGKEEPTQKPLPEKYLRIISNKNFLLYFVPWIMFSLVNYMVIPLIDKVPNVASFSGSIENIVIAVVAVFSGFLADIVGRKRLTIVGFIMLGLGFAALSLSSSALSGLIYILADGTAWGVFYVIFLLTIWGDLAQNKNSDKFYVLGALPYLFSNFMLLLIQNLLPDNSSLVFSFASIFLFLAILPLIYAPETLPEKLIKERELKNYVESAKKKAQKESDKMRNNEKMQPPQVRKNQDDVDNKEYDDAVKLAEKYY